MTSFMILEISIGNKPLATEIAREQLLLSVGPYVLEQAAVMSILFFTPFERTALNFGFVVFYHVFYLVLIFRFRNLNVTFRFNLRFLIEWKMRPFGNSELLKVQTLKFLCRNLFHALFWDFTVEKWLFCNLERPIYLIFYQLCFICIDFEWFLFQIWLLEVIGNGLNYVILGHHLSLKLRIARYFGFVWDPVRCDTCISIEIGGDVWRSYAYII